MAVSYVNAGTRSDAVGNVNLTPSYPASIVAGNLLVLAFAHPNNTTQDDATYSVPGDWQPEGTAVQNATRLFTYYKVAAGTESGTETVTVTTGTAASPHWAQIFQFSGNATTSPVYAGATSSASSATVADAGVTVTATGDMAVNIAIVSAATAVIDDFAGETGGPGDWSKQLEQETQRPFSGLWTAAFTGSGTIDGGTFNAVTSGVWIVRGFAIAAAVVAGVNIPAVVNTRRFFGVQ